MTVGLLVMRYAFPCAEISVRMGNITQEEYDCWKAAMSRFGMRGLRVTRINHVRSTSE